MDVLFPRLRLCVSCFIVLALSQTALADPPYTAYPSNIEYHATETAARNACAAFWGSYCTYQTRAAQQSEEWANAGLLNSKCDGFLAYDYSPHSTSYVEAWPDQHCVSNPPPVCEQGQQITTWQDTVLISVNGELMVDNLWPAAVIGQDGCEYESTIDLSAGNVECKEIPPNPQEGTKVTCERTWIATGNEAADPTASDPVLDTENNQPPAESQQPSNKLTDTSETTYGDPVTETLPDGSEKTTTTTTTTETTDKGVKVETTTDTVRVENHEGITKTTTTTTETVTSPDGTSTVTETVDVEYSGGKIQSGQVKISSGGADEGGTVTERERVQGSSSTTTTTNYDANGNPTGSTTTTIADDGINEEGECVESECGEEGERVTFGAGGSFDQDGQQARLDAAKDELSSELRTIKSEVGAFFGVQGMNETASLPDYSFVMPWPGGGIQIDWDLAEWAQLLSLLAAALFFVFVLLALYIILGD